MSWLVLISLSQLVSISCATATEVAAAVPPAMRRALTTPMSSTSEDLMRSETAVSLPTMTTRWILLSVRKFLEEAGSVSASVSRIGMPRA